MIRASRRCLISHVRAIETTPDVVLKAREIGGNTVEILRMERTDRGWRVINMGLTEWDSKVHQFIINQEDTL
jgi:hypothetical protein|tara:strand:+ start:234 stop:449 length:216 start_codon:yes stop_codon:yes gene_type:complete